MGAIPTKRDLKNAVSRVASVAVLAALAAALLGASTLVAACRGGGMDAPKLGGTLGREQALLRRIEGTAKSSPTRGKLLRKLERLRYFRAKSADTLAAWKYYRRHHPKGLFVNKAQAAIERLRRRRAQRVDRWWYWHFYLTAHPEGQGAEEAEGRLESSLFRYLKKEGDERRLLGFLRRFPKSKHRDQVLDLLAKREYERIRGSHDVAKLELFLKLFPDSKWVPNVKARLEGIWRERVALLGSWRELDVYRRRYPRSPHIKKLREKVGRRMFFEAAAAVDAAALAEVAKRLDGGPLAKEAKRLAQLVKVAGEDAMELRETVRRVLPYRPRARLKTLLAGAAGESLRTAWIASQGLSYFRSPMALEALVGLVGTSPWPLSVTGLTALERWFQNTPDGLAKILASELKRRLKKRLSSLGAALRYAALEAMMGPLRGKTSKVLGKVSASARHRPVATTISLLGVKAGGFRGGRAAEQAVEALEKRWEKIEKALPATTTKSNLPVVRPQTFSLQALLVLSRRVEKALKDKRLGEPSHRRRLDNLLREGEQRLKVTLASVAKVAPDAALDLSPFLGGKRRRAHEMGRKKAFQALKRQKAEGSDLASALLSVVCRRKGWVPAPCASKDRKGAGTAEGTPGAKRRPRKKRRRPTRRRSQRRSGK